MGAGASGNRDRDGEGEGHVRYLGRLMAECFLVSFKSLPQVRCVHTDFMSGEDRWLSPVRRVSAGNGGERGVAFPAGVDFPFRSLPS